MAGPLRVLYLTADARSDQPVIRTLEREENGVEVTRRTDVDGGLAGLDTDAVTCVVIDESVTNATGTGLFGRVKTVDAALPVFVLVRDDADTPRQDLPTSATDVQTLGADELSPSHEAALIENAALRYRLASDVESEGSNGYEESNSTTTANGRSTESETRIERHEYERLLEGLDQGIFVLDEDGEYRYVNPTGAEITGYEPAEIVEAGPSLLFPDPAERERLTTAIRSLSDDDSNTTTVELTLETKDGKLATVEVTLTPRRDERGRFSGVIGVVRCVTEPRDTGRRQRENRTIMRAIPDEIVVIDTDGFLTRAIPAVDSETTSSGYTPEELEGMHVSMVMDDESLEEASELIAEMVTGDRDRATLEMQVVTRNGNRLWRETHFTLLEDEDGTVLGTVSILRDIEERRAYEKELKRQNERLEQFASITSHDLRNPLNLAQGYMEMVEAECNTEHTDPVNDALDRMERLIEDTLTWTRQGAQVDDRRPISLASLADECWEAVGSADGGLRVADDVTIQGAPDRVRRLLENLLRNAVEHGGVDVTVRIGSITDDGQPKGFYVEDDGPGIPPAEGADVFNAGYTTAPDGTGFGLAIVDEIAEAHGWDVAVTESADGGARFEFSEVDR